MMELGNDDLNGNVGILPNELSIMLEDDAQSINNPENEDSASKQIAAEAQPAQEIIIDKNDIDDPASEETANEISDVEKIIVEDQTIEETTIEVEHVVAEQIIDDDIIEQQTFTGGTDEQQTIVDYSVPESTVDELEPDLEVQETEEVKITVESVLDQTFTLRQLIASRFNQDNPSHTSDTSLIVQALVQSLKTDGLNLASDNGFKSLVYRALAPRETENAFHSISEFENAIQNWNSRDFDEMDANNFAPPIQNDEGVIDVSADLDVDDFRSATEPAYTDNATDTGVFVNQEAPEAGFSSLLSRLEKIQREQETIVEEKSQAITNGAVLNGRYVVLEVQNKSKLLTTYKALDILSDKGVVLDVLNANDVDYNRMFANACEAILDAKHDNLICSIECIDISGKTICVREFFEAKSLTDVLTQSQNYQSEGQIASILWQICDGLNALRQRGVVHGNLTSDNVFVAKLDGESLVKIGGLGLHEIKFDLIEQRKLRLDQDRYGSFERYSKFQKESSIDINDLAALAFQLVSGSLPFADTDGRTDQVPTLSQLRPDLLEIELLDNIIRSGLLLNEDEKLAGLEDFKFRISEWLELVRQKDPSRADERVEQISAKNEADENQLVVETQEAGDEAESSFTPSRAFARLLADDSDTGDSRIGRERTASELSEIADDKTSSAEDAGSLVGQVLFGRYAIIDTVGKGHQSTVYAATDLKFDRIVALKQVRPPTPESEPAFNKAIDKFRTFQHPNLIRFLDCRLIDDSPCLILEYAEGETLRNLLNRINYIETEARIGRIAVQICSLLSYLHGKNFAHGNLKTSSIILVESSGDSLIKIGGLCASGVAYESIEGLGKFNANSDKELSEKIQTDIHAVAAIIYEMVTGIKLDEEDHRDDEELVALSAMRPELFEVESLKTIIKNGFTKNGFKTAEQLKNAILSWMEKVSKEFASIELVAQTAEPAQKDLMHRERRVSKSPGAKRWAKQYQGIKFIEAELREELNTLKTNQVKSEATIAMILSRKLAAKRQRKSPLRAVGEVVLISTAVFVTGAIAVNYLSANYETMKAKYLTVARALSKQNAKASTEADTPIDILDYCQDSAYKRWTNTKVFGPPRRIETNGQLREK